jgi:hypothetical protein
MARVERLAPLMRAAFDDPAMEAAFSRDGYVVVPFLDTSLVDDVRAAWERVGPAPDDPRISIHFDFQSQHPEYKRAVRDELRPLLAPRADELLDRYHLFSPTFIMKWPGARSGFAPHQDASVVDESQHRSLSIWCPLTDTPGPDGRDNGVLRFVPGSHRFVSWVRAHDPKGFAFAGHEREIIERYSVPVPVRAGEAIVFDHRTVHFSMPNDGAAARLVVALGMRPKEAALLHYRCVGEDRFDVHEVDDDYYVELSPQQVLDGVPYPKVGEVESRRPRLSAAEFAQLCRSHGNRHRRSLRERFSRRPRRVNPDPFCFRCGSESDLVGTPSAFEDGNVVHICRACVAVGRSA